MILTLAQLQAAMPDAGPRAAIFLESLNHAMLEFGIDTAERQSAFMSQIAHESGSLRYTKEIWGPTPAQLGYEGRADLGNTHVSDGVKFLGRGLIQCTGRRNTLACLAALGRKEDDITYLETPIGASRSAAWFWKTHGLNEHADRRAFWTITKTINGGTNGLDERIRFYVAIRKLFGI